MTARVMICSKRVRVHLAITLTVIIFTALILLYRRGKPGFLIKSCPTTIHQDYFADLLNGYSPEETLPDCMSDKALDKYRGSSNSKGRIKDCHLCEHYKGRLLSQYCNYRHPNIVHYVKLSKPNAKNKLTFQEFVSILSVDN